MFNITGFQDLKPLLFFSVLVFSSGLKAQTWSNTGSLTQARQNHTATLLNNNNVLVAGGFNGGALANCNVYDAINGTWSVTGSLSTPRYIHSATRLNDGRVLVAGGYSGVTYLNSCELYDPGSGTWSNTGSMAFTRRSHSSTRLANGNVLVAGGYNGSYLTNCQVFDPGTGTWNSTGSLAVPRMYHSATLLNNGMVLVAGGQNPTYLSSCRLYDPNTGTWGPTGSMSVARRSHTATLLNNGMVLVTGGFNGSYLSSCELYDPNTGTWSSTGSLALTRLLHTATKLTDGRVLVAGGFNGSYLSTCRLYDPATGTWSATGSLNGARRNQTATLLANGKVLVSGGFNGVTLSSSELYTPCYRPDVPTVSANPDLICSGSSATLSIASGNLNDATYWQWYTGSCAGTPIGTGTSIVVSPEVTTTYYVRGEGGCEAPGNCAGSTVTVYGAGIPVATNIYNGNVNLTTQSQVNSFFNGVNGKKYTEINGNLLVDGGSLTDPINQMCNLRSLIKVSGSVTITNFNQNGNPSDLYDLTKLRIVGGGFGIYNSKELITLNLIGLNSVGGEFSIQSNSNANSLVVDSLSSVGTSITVRNNYRLLKLYLSRLTSSFGFSTNTNYVNIYNNGDSSAGALVIDCKKITSIDGNLQFSDNDNPGVSNFDNIFTNLSNVTGSLSVNNNAYLNTCCIAVNVTVGLNRNIINNTGNCANLAVAQANCLVLPKRAGKTMEKNADMFAQLRINPSPNNGKFELYLNTLQTGNVNVSIANMIGKSIYTSSFEVTENNYIPFSLEDLAEGQYILRVELNGNVQYRRFMVSR
ncbi:MAG: T9SS type A sorting domain-containing protein [Flavobacteriales bacterium]|nr:T9SS type A sorting domain-containing protein [Flavobacteriales bacterium]